MNIVIPMAGLGSRFKEAGFKEIKPLITLPVKYTHFDEVHLIDLALSNIIPPGKHKLIFIIREEDYQVLSSNLDSYANEDVAIYYVRLSSPTEGAPCTILKAKDLINTKESVLIANCDQYIEFEIDDFLDTAADGDGAILTFNSTNPHHSYVKLNKKKVITETAEKKVISDHAVAGLYFVNEGRDLVKALEKMIEKDIRTNGEYYVTPAFNFLIEEGKEIMSFEIPPYQKHMLGTPYELQIFIDKLENGEVAL